MTEQSDEVLVVHDLREAASLFGRAPDTIRQWALKSRIEASQDPATKRWTIRIPRDHPDLPENRPPESHYPQADRVVDERDARIATLEAEIRLLMSERDFLREQHLAYQRQLPELAERLLRQLAPPALPAPDPPPRPWWRRWLS